MSYSSDPSLQSNQLPVSFQMPDPKSPEFKQVTELHFKRIVDAVNTKEGAVYQPIENATFKQLFSETDTQNPRFVYRKCFDMVELNGGNIAGSATVAFPHDITSLTNTMLIYASCTSTDPKYFTVVYTNVGAVDMGVWLDATNVNFVNPLSSELTECIVVAEYTKN